MEYLTLPSEIEIVFNIQYTLMLTSGDYGS